MMMGACSMNSSVEKFNAERAKEYADQSRIGLAGYDACHELTACLLSSALGRGGQAHILIVGVGGTGQEILTCGRLQKNWHFTGVDPSPPMLAGAQAAVEAANLTSRTIWHSGLLKDLNADQAFDAATLIGVLHHLPSQAEKIEILKDIALRLKPGAPFVIACNRGRYQENTLFLDAWSNRWRMAGTTEEQVQPKINKILQGAKPPDCDEEVADLLLSQGFEAPALFFSSLFWGAWITRRR